MVGQLIVLEGIDNAGKTSQVSNISAYLSTRGVAHHISKELTTPIGQLIRSYFETHSFTPMLKALLFAADRMQRLEQEIEPALKSDSIVLADRWTLSALAYRIVEGLDKQYVLQVNSLVRLPDVTVLLDIPSDESLKRGQIAGKSCPYSTAFLEAARQCYRELADQFQLLKYILTLVVDIMNGSAFFKRDCCRRLVSEAFLHKYRKDMLGVQENLFPFMLLLALVIWD